MNTNMSTISNRNVVSQPPVIINPNFFLPPGVVDARYINDEDTEGIYAVGADEFDEIQVVDGTDIPGTELPPDPTIISAPTTMTIISQSVSIAPDGRFVVDVLIEVEDIPGVVNFDVRLTKV